MAKIRRGKSYKEIAEQAMRISDIAEELIRREKLYGINFYDGNNPERYNQIVRRDSLAYDIMRRYHDNIRKSEKYLRAVRGKRYVSDGVELAQAINKYSRNTYMGLNRG